MLFTSITSAMPTHTKKTGMRAARIAFFKTSQYLGVMPV
jgi:hypothetical protein